MSDDGELDEGRPPPRAVRGGLRARLAGWWKGIGQLIVGWTLIAVGVLLLPLPGPGLLVILLGLSLLARRLHWARRILAKLRALRRDKRDVEGQ